MDGSMDGVSAALGVFGLIVGALAAVLGPSAGEAPAIDPARIDGVATSPGMERIELVELPGACGPRREALESERARLSTRLGAAQLTRRFLEAQRVDREGEPIPWEGRGTPLDQPEALERHLSEALAATGVGELTDLDCQEFPCIASFRIAELQPDGGVGMGPYEPLFDELNARGFEDHELITARSTTRDMGDGYRQIVTLAVGPAEVLEEKNVRVRTRFRAEKVFEAATSALEQEAAP